MGSTGFGTRMLPLITLVLLGLATGGSAQLADSFNSLSRELLQLLANDGQIVVDETPDQVLEPEVYDFVVIGAGTAGATVASRLSENEDVDVLLIEAGGDEWELSDIPGIVAHLQFSSTINWMYQTEASDNYCRGMTNRRCNYPRGKVMGGSSVLNYLIGTRGNAKDYDNWAALGNEGWSYEEVLPYFKKFENLSIPALVSDTEMHNTGGPVNIMYPPSPSGIGGDLLNGAVELGYDILDYNGRNQSGFSRIYATMTNGERMSSNRAYIDPVRDRVNFFLSKNSLVSKILINETTMSAYGVRFIKDGREVEVQASKEVILSAGTIGSPQVLMLSGIGPRDHLVDMGIDVIRDAPVGENFQDHVSYAGSVFLINDSSLILFDDIFDPANTYMSDYLNSRTGPLTGAGGAEGLGFIDVTGTSETQDYPDMEILLNGDGSLLTNSILRSALGISDEVWNETFAAYVNQLSFMIFPLVLRPKSRGRILLADNDINTHPRIIPNYLDDPDDVRVLMAGMRAAIALSQTEIMQTHGAQFLNVALPACSDYEYDSDAYWECAFRTLTMNFYHYSGTCKMAPEDDSTAVVNPRLQVIGIDGLRVVDGSIIPLIPSAHTNLPIYMIAEKAADMIKEDWNMPTDALP